jgi:type II secretory pathway pseudopilin PulG
MPRRPRTRSFSLLELLVVVLIMAVVIAGAVFFTANYVTWAKNTSDKQTYTILNDALTRWKTEGGNVGVLTVGTPVGEVLQYMLTPITLAGNESHICLRPGSTYPARSIVAAGNYAQYHFAQYNTYSDGTTTFDTPTSQYPGGRAYLANDGHTDYNFGVTSTTGYIAVQAGSGSPTVQDGTMNNADTASGSNPSITFWSCLGSGPTPTAPSGTITQIDLTSGQVADYGNGCNLTSIDVGGLKNLNWMDVSGNASITGSAGSLNSLYSGLPTVTSGQLNVNDDGQAATGSSIGIAADKGWQCDVPSPILPTPAAYPGSGGATMSHASGYSTWSYSVIVSTTTNYLAYQPQGGSAVMIGSGSLTIPACSSVTVWSVDITGKATGSIVYFKENNNELGSLDIHGCTGLQTLQCGYNQLSTLSVSGCPSLSWLSCEYNQLGSLDVSGDAALTYISCGNNQLTSLSNASGLTHLQTLGCDSNQISTLNVSGCPNLTYLNCSDDNFGTINVTGDSLLPLYNAGNNNFQVQGNPNVSVTGQ